jgi:D-alanyl-D-alanine carboxypeptidase (penicillin-binding protein 5/6)
MQKRNNKYICLIFLILSLLAVTVSCSAKKPIPFTFEAYGRSLVGEAYLPDDVKNPDDPLTGSPNDPIEDITPTSSTDVEFIVSPTPTQTVPLLPTEDAPTNPPTPAISDTASDTPTADPTPIVQLTVTPVPPDDAPDGWYVDASDFATSVIAEKSSIVESSGSGISAKSALLIDIDDGPVFAKNAFTRTYPASTTKIMTAYLALNHYNLDDLITVKTNLGGVTNEGAAVMGFKKGDIVSMETLLNCLLIRSSNDAAAIIAEAVAGSVESFAEMMNAQAVAFGATDTHFVNPHGLHVYEHATTPYDMYLIFNQCIKNNTFLQMISQESYNAVYTDLNNYKIQAVLKSTSPFAEGKSFFDDAYVFGGKTGTTPVSGYNMVLLCEKRLSNGQIHKFIAAVYGASSYNVVYSDVVKMLKMVE